MIEACQHQMQSLGMKALLCFAAFVGVTRCLGAEGGPVDTQIEQAVLIELFTSQGCSSCPPADANLKRLASLAEEKGYPIYTLSFHVDYWNNLGWEDPFSSREATNRQKMYSKAFRLNRIYTPQFVVNGQWEFVGSNRTQTRAAILQALQTQPSAELSISSQIDSSNITVNVTASQYSDGDQLVIALVQNEAQADVDKGENSGRSLHHIHVVREFQRINVVPSASVVFLKPDSLRASDFHILAYVQGEKDLSLQAIARSPVAIAKEGGAP